MVMAKQANLYLVFLKNLNSNVKVFDDNLIINKKYIIKNVVNFNADYIFLSPGINIYNNKYTKYLKRNKKNFYRYRFILFTIR